MNEDAIPTGKRFYVGRGGLASELISKDMEVACIVRKIIINKIKKERNHIGC